MSMTIQLSENTNGHTTLGPIPTHRNIRKVPSFRVSASASTLGWQRGSIQCKLALRYTVSVQKVSQMSHVTHYSKLKQFASLPKTPGTLLIEADQAHTLIYSV